jgi:hypothetical protein
LIIILCTIEEWGKFKKDKTLYKKFDKKKEYIYLI